MKIIFLDFDGVLDRYDEPESFMMLSSSCVENLNRLIERSGTKIVISSCWRAFHPMKDLKQILINAGFKYTDHIIGVTPELIYEPKETCRGDEIAKWLKECNENIESFVILDDDDDVKPFLDKLIQTDFNVGLTMCDVEKAIEILNK